MADEFLTFELAADSDQLDVHGTPSGLRRLAAILERLASRGKPDPEHLATPEWAGDELSSDTQGDGKALNFVTIRCWPEGRAE